MPSSGRYSSRLRHALAFTWGACTFFPVGVGYLNLLLMLVALATCGSLRERVARFRCTRLAWPMAAFLAWALVAAAAGPWLEDSPTRLFHIVRVLLVLTMGMLLSPSEARLAIGGFLVAALLAALAVAVHHVWGLPEWDIWGSLLRSRNNFSSGNMIMMATAAGLLFYLGLGTTNRGLRWTAWGGALALTVTVAEHALSRNAQLMVPALILSAMVFHFRNWRALIAGLAAVVIVGAAAWQFSPSTHERFDAGLRQVQTIFTESNYTTSVGVRWRMYQEAWQGMMEQPVFGTGLGSWLPRWKPVAAATGQRLEPEMLVHHIEINNPHNDFLLTGMETGVPGLLTMAWLMFAFLRIGWRRRTVAGGVTVLLSSALVCTALINAPLRDAALGMTLLWLLGASVAAHQESAHA